MWFVLLTKGFSLAQEWETTKNRKEKNKNFFFRYHNETPFLITIVISKAKFFRPQSQFRSPMEHLMGTHQPTSIGETEVIQIAIL